MNYVDATVFVSAVVYSDNVPDAVAARRWLRRVATGGTEASTSVLTWDEVVWSVRKALGTERGAAHGRLLLQYPGVSFLPATTRVLALAQDLVESHGLKPRDAIHAATAIDAGLDTILSFDPDFDRVPGLKRKTA